METSKSKAVAFIVSAVLTIIVVGVIVIVDGYNAGFHQFLVSLTGYHWVTKSVIAAVLFVLFSVIFYLAFKSTRVRERLRTDNLWAWTVALIIVTVVLYLVIIISYTIEYLG